MKNRFLFFAAFMIALAVAGCSKSEGTTCVANNTGVPTAAEIASLQSYLSSHSITATQDPGGFFYVITAPGSGTAPSASSTITFTYRGTLENGNVFDEKTAGVTYPLSQLILGWQKGLPLIKEGGSITLYLPPSLGYGCASVGSIPPGSNLIFTVNLLDVL